MWDPHARTRSRTRAKRIAPEFAIVSIVMFNFASYLTIGLPLVYYRAMSMM